MMSKTWPIEAENFRAPGSYFSTAAEREVVFGSFGEFVRTMFRGVRRWYAARKTAATLSQLEDHRLDDIGVARGDISTVAQQLAQHVR